MIQKKFFFINNLLMRWLTKFVVDFIKDYSTLTEFKQINL